MCVNVLCNECKNLYNNFTKNKKIMCIVLFFSGSSWQRPWVRYLGSWLAGLGVLHAWHNTTAGALAW